MKFLDKIFKKEKSKPEQIVSLSLDDFERLINDKIENNSRWLSEFKESFSKIVEELNNSAKDLKKVSFEKGVDVRVEDRVNDNIDNYINKINILTERLNKIDFSFFKLNDLINEYNKEISKFNKETIKNYYLIQMVFKNDVTKVAKSLKDLDFLFKDINNKTDQKEYKEYIDLLKNLDSLIKCKNKLYNINKILSEKKEDQNSVVKEISDTKDLLDEINKSDEYINYKRLESQREEYIEEIGFLKKDILNNFQIFERGFKKLNRISPSKKLGNYCETPLSFFDDENLEIFDFIDKLKECILSKEIDLEDKNKKVLEFIDSIKKEKFIELKDKYSNLLDNIKKIDKELSESIILNKIIDYNYKIGSLKIKLDNLDLEISNLNISELEKEYLDIKNIIEEKYYHKFSQKILIEKYVYS